MNIFDFINEDELNDLPEDPAMAFMTFVRTAQSRLYEREKKLDLRDENDWHLAQEARHGFMNTVIAAAKRFQIEPFLSMDVPRLNKFDHDDHKQFKADLDHYMTQLVLDNSLRTKRDSVLINPEVKDKIRKYVYGLKTEIDKADLTDSKRAALLDKLAEFEKELDKKRLNLLAVTGFVMTILSAPGAIWASYDIVSKLTANILQTIGEAKTADDENRRLPPIEKPAALLPPRKKEQEDAADFDRSEMDDEIPF